MLDHLGFNVGDYAASRDFYRQALAPLGYAIAMDVTREMTGSYEGCGSGPPGLRPHYHPDYYGAFVIDLDGHNIEAMCHSTEP